MNDLILSKAELKMSSREIAELIKKQHGHIKVSAERLKSGQILTFAVREFNHNGNTYIEYLFDKRDSIILVAQNCPEFTAALVDRWQELEGKQVPQTLSQALRLAADQAELIEQQNILIEQQKPAVEFIERYVDSEQLKGFREVAKLLKLKEPEFRSFLVDHKIMYKLAGAWVAYQNHIDAGRFKVVAVLSNSGFTANETKFTTKGVEWLYRIMGKS